MAMTTQVVNTSRMVVHLTVSAPAVLNGTAVFRNRYRVIYPLIHPQRGKVTVCDGFL